MKRFRFVQDDAETSPVIVMQNDNGGDDLISTLRKRLNENKMLEEFFKDVDKKKDEKKKPQKIAVGLSASEVFALMIISAFPIVALSSTMMSWCMAVIRSNVHEMFK